MCALTYRHITGDLKADLSRWLGGAMDITRRAGRILSVENFRVRSNWFPEKKRRQLILC